MKNSLKKALLLSIACIQLQYAADTTSYDDVRVSIPICLKERRYFICSLCNQHPNADLEQLIKDFDNDSTTIGTLYRSVQIAAESCVDCPELTQLSEELTEVYRKKCCCWPSSVTSLTVTGTLKAGTITATNNITTTAGNLVASGSGLGVIVGGGAKVISGTGTPNGTVTAPQGSLYLRLDGSSAITRAYINTDGSTTWTAVTTAA